jgi:hypothetical protein
MYKETSNVVKGTQPSDIWSPEALRIDQSFLNVGAAKKLLTTVPVRKPNKQNFVRVNPVPAYRLTVGLIELKENRETFLVLPAVSQELSGKLPSYRLGRKLVRCLSRRCRLT